MRWFSIAAIFFLFWFLALFAVLPFSAGTAEEAGEKPVVGHAESAPAHLPSLADRAAHDDRRRDPDGGLLRHLPDGLDRHRHPAGGGQPYSLRVKGVGEGAQALSRSIACASAT